MSARRGTTPVRGYALTPWSRALVDVVEGRPGGQATSEIVENRKITKARSYFRDRNAHRVSIGDGMVTAVVEGSQLDPFEVFLEVRTVDATTVVSLLAAAGGITDVMYLARGEQPDTLGELLLPTESADIVGDCTCPDSSGRCIHVLTVTYEIAAEIDRTPLTLLTLMGTSLPELLAAIEDVSGEPSGLPDNPLVWTESRSAPPTVDFYGTGATAPPLPSPPRMNPMTDLDTAALRAALRASGVAPGDIAEAVDELGDLYDRLVEE